MYSLYDKNGGKRRENLMLIKSILKVIEFYKKTSFVTMKKEKNPTKPKFPLG